MGQILEETLWPLTVLTLPSITNNNAVSEAVPSYKWIPPFPAMKLRKISALMLTAMKIQLSSGKEATVVYLTQC
jgi:hypothetical protein